MNRPTYEKSDLNVRPIGIFAIVLVVIIIFVLVVSKGLLRYLTSRPMTDSYASSAKAAQPAIPAEPKLQSDPHKDLVELRAKEEKILTSYGWVDEAKGIVRIPIERAMVLVLRDLQSRSSPPR